VGFEERLAIIIGAKDDGAASVFGKVGSAAEDAGKKTAASAEAVAIAQSKSKLAGIGAQRAAVDLAAAQRTLAAVTAKSTSTDEQKKRATLAVQTAEVKHADAARAAGKAETEASRASKAHAATLEEVKVGSNSAGAAMKTALTAGAVAAGYAIVQFGKKAVTAASDLSESTSKAQVVFGDSSDAVLKFGDSAAKGLGQSKQQAIEATGSFGALFVAMGIGQKPAADLSISIVKLASDLASFNNTSPEEALTALRSGLIGETEPLRQFGVNLNAVAIGNEAVRLGLAKTPAAASTAAKAQAAYSLILQQTKTAQGDFARTAGGAANQQRILAAQSADLAATSGKLLLPALIAVERAAIGVAKPLGSMASGLAGLPPEAKAAGLGMLGVAAAAKTITIAVPAGQKAITGMVDVIKNLKPGSLAAGAGLAVFGIAVGVLVQKLNEGKQKAADFLDTLVKTSGAETAAGQLNVYRDALTATGTATKLTSEQRFQAIVRSKALQVQQENETQATRIAAEAAAKNTVQVDLNAQSIGKQGAITSVTATHMNEFGEKVNNATGKVLEQKSAVDELTFSLDKLNGKNIAAAEGSIDFRNSLAALQTAVKDNGRSLDETSQKGRDNRTAFINAAKSAADFSAKIGDQKGYNAGRAALIASRAELERTAVKLGLSKAEVDKLIGAFLRIPPVKRTAIDLRIAQALKDAARIQSAISQVKGKAVTVQVNQSGSLQTITRDLQRIAGYGTIAVNIRVNGKVAGFSKGGEVSGGIPGQDSVPALLMPGEYVETVAERRANRLRLSRPASTGPTDLRPQAAAASGVGPSAAQIAAGVRDALNGMTLVLRDPLGRAVAGQLAAAGGRGAR
jgi:hypothetical protein